MPARTPRRKPVDFGSKLHVKPEKRGHGLIPQKADARRFHAARAAQAEGKK